jgi:hypothetical protein
MAFHVTPKENIESILKNGLIPQIGYRSRKIEEKNAAIYFFINKEECENALGNWLGDEFDDENIGDLLILEVDVDDKYIRLDSNGNVFFEMVVTEPVGVEKIKRIYTEDYKKFENSFK